MNKNLKFFKKNGNISNEENTNINIRNYVAWVCCGLFFMPGTMFEIVKKMERKASGLEQKSVEVNGMNIQYLEGGSGEPLVLIHGFGANKDNWTRIGKFLTPHFHVIAPDLPGFGESSKEPNGKYTIKDQAVFLKKFIEKIIISPT